MFARLSKSRFDTAVPSFILNLVNAMSDTKFWVALTEEEVKPHKGLLYELVNRPTFTLRHLEFKRNANRQQP